MKKDSDFKGLIGLFLLILALLFISFIIAEKANSANVKSAEYDFRQYEYIGNYKITTYYTPVKNQKKYYSGSYEQDYYINCQGDCLVTASGYRLTEKDAFKIMACPPSFEHGTELKIKLISGYWEGETIYTTCQDRGGAIKRKRLDLWTGIGDEAWIGKYSGKAEVYILN